MDLCAPQASHTTGPGTWEPVRIHRLRLLRGPGGANRPSQVTSGPTGHKAPFQGGRDQPPRRGAAALEHLAVQSACIGDCTPQE